MSLSNTVSNQQAYEMYRRSMQSALARPTPIIDTGSVWGRQLQMISQWLVRYSKRREFIDGREGSGVRLADRAAVDALVARSLAQDARFPQLPDWEAMTFSTVAMSWKSMAQLHGLDITSLADPCRYGPSLRRLWGEAKARGLDDEEAWRAMMDWANHYPPEWKNDDETKRRKRSSPAAGLDPRLETAVVWTRTPDLDYPWASDFNGENWQVRLNDFPDEHMYTLFVNGTRIVDFDDWPDMWDRGDRHRAAEPQAPAVIAVKGAFLERYQAGECATVWAELVSLGPRVREPEYWPEAVAVARETMRRARHNVERLIPRLDSLGYRFWSPGGRRKQSNSLKDPNVFLPPSRSERRKLDAFEREGNVLPLSLRAWMEEVGRVDLAGAHAALCFLEQEADFPGIYADPLMVIPNADSLEDMMGLAGDSENGLFISMDDRDKAGLGTDRQLDSNYWMELPNSAADGSLKGYRREITFVEYLRLSFQWGGFPGWSGKDHRPERELAVLTDGLLPI